MQLSPTFTPSPLPQPRPKPLNLSVDLPQHPLPPTVEAVQKSRAVRRSKFSKQDDLLLLREVCAAKAHVSPNGETKERFEVVAVKPNQTRKVSFELTWKSAQDRYKRLQARLDTHYRAGQLMSGAGGAQGELEELLSEMRDARQDLLSRKEERRTAALEREAEKERLSPGYSWTCQQAYALSF